MRSCAQNFLSSSPRRRINDRNRFKPTEILSSIKVPLLLLITAAFWLVSFVKPTNRIPGEKVNLAEEFITRQPVNTLQGEFHFMDQSRFEKSFHVPDIDQVYDPSLEQMWQCQDHEQSNKKLVFLHVFKTAGSTIRSLLQAYSHKCHTGLAIVVSCTSLSMDSLGTRTSWRNGYGRREGNRCKLKNALGRSQNTLPIPQDESINTTFLEQHVDILGGHLPIGSDYGWKGSEGKPVEVQYIVFLRDAVRKYVSGVLYKNPTRTLEEVVPKIKDFVTKERFKKKYYEKYSSYLISPEQNKKYRDQGIELTREQRVNLTMVNLVESNILVGIVERMSESLEMIKYVIDRNNDLETMFEFFGMKDKDGQIQKHEINKSTLSSSTVLAELEMDPDFMTHLREYVKYDDRIHAFATELHKRQYESMKLVNNTL